MSAESPTSRLCIRTNCWQTLILVSPEIEILAIKRERLTGRVVTANRLTITHTPTHTQRETHTVVYRERYRHEDRQRQREKHIIITPLRYRRRQPSLMIELFCLTPDLLLGTPQVPRTTVKATGFLYAMIPIKISTPFDYLLAMTSRDPKCQVVTPIRLKPNI